MLPPSTVAMDGALFSLKRFSLPPGGNAIRNFVSHPRNDLLPGVNQARVRIGRGGIKLPTAGDFIAAAISDECEPPVRLEQNMRPQPGLESPQLNAHPNARFTVRGGQSVQIRHPKPIGDLRGDRASYLLAKRTRPLLVIQHIHLRWALANDHRLLIESRR